jgi:hypothetical protein
MSATARNQVFTSVHTIGALLPADMLLRISEGKDVSGSTPADYHLVGSRNVQDEAERHWDYLKGIWRDLRAKLPYAPDASAPADPTGLGQTQWLEPLFAELGFGRLTRTATGIPSDDGTKTFPISHRWQHVPIHLTAWNTDLDKRPAPGTVPPQSLVQECLNRADAHLWALLSNGRQLRLLRDSTAMTGAAYVEFDLEAIFDGELFSEFVMLYRLLHVSRFEVPEGTAASGCRLEKWRTEAIESGVRALDQLREGVRTAITTLGTGFLRHPANAELRDNLDVRALHYALLRLVYRLLFLFVAEDRGALLHPEADEVAQRRYRDYFSSARLRRHAERRRGTAHGDLYQALHLVFAGLGSEDGRPELGLPGLGGIFDDTDSDQLLRGVQLANEDLLAAVRALAIVYDVQAKRTRSVDYQHLGAEELGSVYESLLELVPKHDAAEPSFELAELAGNARKTTGSYYTPTSLIECLLDSALNPVIDDAIKRGEERAAQAGQSDPRDAVVGELLSLTVCDPACGSGHFLVASARRIAKQVAAVREQNPEPTVGALRAALRDVVARCIYGVDLNPMAVELAKVSLWLEALEPGKALGFLDAHIKRGNALMGTTPELLQNGIPDDAFKPIEGDDKKYAAALKKLNAKQVPGQEQLFETELEVKVANLIFATSLHEISTAKADDLRDVRKQAEAYREWEQNTAYLHARHVADAWCAAFVWPKRPEAPQAPTNAVFRAIQNPAGLGATATTNAEIVRLAGQYAFFHWHLEFPEVFQVPSVREGTGPAGWSGGFSFIGGNPPWERIKLQEQEFFAQRDVAIATAPHAAARKKLIAALPESQPDLYEEFAQAKRRAEGESHFLRNSQRYPLTGRGDINTYAVFAETDRDLTAPDGRMGVIVPTGIATDATTQHFFRDLVNCGSLAGLYDFENRGGLFPAVDSRMKFSLLTLAGRALREAAATFAFFLHDPTELDEPGRGFPLTPEEINLLNPNTGTCPVFRSRRDAEITLGIYDRVPVLVKEGAASGNPWGFEYVEVLHLSHAAAELMTEAEDERGTYPVYEAKMMHHFDHRWFSYPDVSEVDRNNPALVAMPRYRVNKRVVDQRLGPRWDREWMVGWRDICRATDERTVIAGVVPRAALAHTLPLAVLADPRKADLLLGMLSSFAFDYAARQKVAGTHLTMIYLRQCPTLPPSALSEHQAFIRPRVLELVYTAHDMAPFASDLGDVGGPFRWDEERRAVMRAELDALFFHLYGIGRDDVDYIMETFTIVKRKDLAKFGSYRTKELILDLYDRMAAEGLTLANALTDPADFSSLTPPPGKGIRHPAFEVS